MNHPRIRSLKAQCFALALLLFLLFLPPRAGKLVGRVGFGFDHLRMVTSGFRVGEVTLSESPRLQAPRTQHPDKAPPYAVSLPPNPGP
ncbi:unnamed protein product [Cuscuta campestris]|uniref:Uncharacterized protein n=1 Tax=Cuscuta campestris TaxID=132261 RepID=A0A484N918_9ASTE|nr:unnamed protein product [Cuscuta campestris]